MAGESNMERLNRVRGDAAGGHAEPRTVEEAREAIDSSRARISGTLDRIEDRIVERKEAIREKANVLGKARGRIRANPRRALGAAFGAGVLLGLATGGDEEKREGMIDEDERAELRRWRAERRSHLRALGAEERERPSQGRGGGREGGGNGLVGELTRTLGSAILSGVTGGLKDRANRMMKEKTRGPTGAEPDVRTGGG